MSAESKDARKIYTDEQTDKGEKKDKARRYAPFTLDRKKVLSALIFHPLLCFTSGTPLVKKGQAVACPRVAQKSGISEVSVSFSGSTGAVGRHNNTSN